jgi:hypothetical protein
MKDKHYMSWFRQVVEWGWTGGLYHPAEILTEYVRNYYSFTPYEVKLPYDHIERFMIDTTTHDIMSMESVSLQVAIDHFNAHYPDRRMDFGVCVRGAEHAPKK